MNHFDDDDFDDDPDDDHEALRARFEKERKETENHPLYKQSIEVEDTLEALVNCCGAIDAEGMAKDQVRLLQDSMMMIKVKLYSALRSKNYFISMQNAAIIRDHAEYLRLSSHTLKRLPGFDAAYVAVFRQEMETFRELFKDWAREIKELDKDEFEDEWGLF